MAALSDFDLGTLESQFQQWGLKAAHARPLLRRFYDADGCLDYADLPLDEFGRSTLRTLDRQLPPRQSKILYRHASGDATTKILIGFTGGGAVESVLMPAYRPDRAAGCVSSQIGCAMGCDFCASTLAGFERHLEAGEIVEQYLHLRALAAGAGRRLATLVFMGMGEPLHNLPNVIAAIQRIAHPETGALGWRQITVSTVGIVPGIDELARSGLNVHLALSLHAPDDETRSRLVPVNRRWPVQEILAAGFRYARITGRVLNIEYCLMRGINDSPLQADLLAHLVGGRGAHVNLIPYNPIGAGLSGKVYVRPEAVEVESFYQRLRLGGVVTHVRRPRGNDVSAACGQLAGAIR